MFLVFAQTLKPTAVSTGRFVRVCSPPILSCYYRAVPVIRCPTVSRILLSIDLLVYGTPLIHLCFYGVEYLVFCRFLTFIAMGDKDSKDRYPEESEVSEPTLSEAAIKLANIFGMTVDELREEMRVRSIPYAGLTHKLSYRWPWLML